MELQTNTSETDGPTSLCNDTEKVFNDPIHGSIRLHSLLVKIIDTPQFQRLRYIKQLGGCYFVYPGASHNRFEHSIGVAHLAGKLIENIRRKQGDKLDIDDRDILCVKIAGLCHDLGHGPFSHLWDNRFLKRNREQKEESEKWKHEEGSVKMLDYLIKTNKLEKEFVAAGLIKTPSDTEATFYIEFIKELINPNINEEASTSYEEAWPYPDLRNKSFLFEIVANKRNGVDVDKWDYFKRDCHHLGIACSFDIDRAMEFVRVIEVDGLRQICFRDKEVPNIYQLFQTRLSLYRAAYYHKTHCAVECMLTEALLLADPHFVIHGHDEDTGKAVELKMSKCNKKMGVFVKLTDRVIQRILELDPEQHKDIKLSQELLQRIQKRDLYKLIGHPIPRESKEQVKSLAEDIAQHSAALTKDDLELDVVNYNFGKKTENPVNHVRFYSKSDHDTAKQLRPENVSKMLPKDDFQEVVIRVYCKSASKLEEAKKCFTEWCKERSVEDDTGHLLDGSYGLFTPVKKQKLDDTQSSDDNASKSTSAKKQLFN